MTRPLDTNERRAYDACEIPDAATCPDHGCPADECHPREHCADCSAALGPGEDDYCDDCAEITAYGGAL